jgi:outer membrane receptor protein involved in Fe transport
LLSYQIDKKVVDVSRNPMVQGGSAVEALENVPSVNVDIEGNVSLRGSTNFTVLIDGRQSTLSGTDALNQIPASAIDKIELITNPSVKYDPDGTAGIINIITKKGKLKGHSLLINASAGNMPNYSTDITYAYRAKKITFNTSTGFRLFDMSFDRNEEYIAQITDSTTNDTGIRFRDTDRKGTWKRNNFYVKSGIEYNYTPNNTLVLSGGVRITEFGRDLEGQIHKYGFNETETFQTSRSSFFMDPNSYEITLSNYMQLGGEEDHLLDFTATYQWQDEVRRDSSSLFESNASWEELSVVNNRLAAEIPEIVDRFRFESNYSRTFAEQIKLEGGYTFRSFQYIQRYNQFVENHAGIWEENVFLQDRADFERYIHAAWFLVSGKKFGFQYQAGLRSEYTDRQVKLQQNNQSYVYENLDWFPSLAITKEWSGGITMQANYSRRINRPRDWHLNPFPSLSDGYIQFKPNPELKPEYADAIELNTQKSWGPSFIALELFYRNTENEFERRNTVIADTLTQREIVNLGSQLDAGSELSANIKATNWLTINPQATLSYVAIEANEEDLNVDKANFEFRSKLNLSFSLNTKTRLQLNGNYNGRRETIDGYREATYWISGAFRGEFLDRKLSASVRFDDILSTRKRESYSEYDNIKIYALGQRKTPVIIFSLQYRFKSTTQCCTTLAK